MGHPVQRTEAVFGTLYRVTHEFSYPVQRTEAVFKLKTLDKKMQLSLFWKKHVTFLALTVAACFLLK